MSASVKRPLLIAGGVAIGDFVDGGGGPFGLEDDGALENFVVLKVEADAEVVEVAAEEQHLRFVGEAVLTADVAVLLYGDGVAALRVVFEGGADAHPVFGQRGADVGEL